MVLALGSSAVLLGIVLSLQNIISFKVVLLLVIFIACILHGSQFCRMKWSEVVGVYLFIVSEIFVFFAAFWAILHSGGEGVEVAPASLKGLPLLGSAFLALSCWFSAEFLKDQSMECMWYTLLCGSAFLGVSLVELCSIAKTREGGVIVNSLYFLILLHCSHVFIGLCYLWVGVLGQNFIGEGVGPFTSCAVLYWHFVDVMWCLVLAWWFWYV